MLRLTTYSPHILLTRRPNPSPNPSPTPSPHYSGAWTDESTFVVTVLDASGSEVALRKTNPNHNPNYIPNPNHIPNPNPSPNP